MSEHPLQQKSYLHYDPNRVDYAISGAELAALKTCGDNQWKEFGVGCFAVAVPCILNAISMYRTAGSTFSPDLPFTLNVIIGSVGALGGAAFLVAWGKSKVTFDGLIAAIKSKPRIEVKTETFAWGQSDED